MNSKFSQTRLSKWFKSTQIGRKIPCGSDPKCKCKRKFLTQHQMMTHLSAVQSIKTCALCSRTYESRQKYENHKACHWNVYESCPICNAKFPKGIKSSKLKFLAHLDHHTPSESGWVGVSSFAMVDIQPLTPYSFLYDDHEYVIVGEYIEGRDGFTRGSFECSTIGCCDSRMTVYMRQKRLETVECAKLENPHVSHTKAPRGIRRVRAKPEASDSDTVTFNGGKVYRKEVTLAGLTKYRCSGCPATIYFDGSFWATPLHFVHSC